MENYLNGFFQINLSQEMPQEQVVYLGYIS